MREDLARRSLASALSVFAAISFVLAVGSEWYYAFVPISLLVVATLLVQLRSLGAQLFARAIWWSNLAFGMVVTSTSSGSRVMWFATLTLASGAALLVAGRKRLADASAVNGHLPAALRSALVLLMIFALADAQTFLFFGTVGQFDHNDKLGQPLVMIAVGIGYAIGFFGLYRLQVWGAFLNALLSVLVLGMLFGFDLVPRLEPRRFLAVLAILHVLVALPIGIVAITGRSLPSVPARARGLGADAVVAMLMLWAAWLLVTGRPTWSE